MHCVVAQRATSSARRFRIRVSSYHDCRCNRLDINGETGTIECRYDYGDDLFCQVDLPESEAPEPHYFVYDGLGSTRSLTDNQGTIEPGQQYNYQPFGEGIDHPTQLATNYLFTGEQFDQEANFYHLRARQYDPSLGRFTSFDPADDYANRLHRYSYCAEDSVNYSDLSGKWLVIAIAVVAAIVITCLWTKAVFIGLSLGLGLIALSYFFWHRRVQRPYLRFSGRMIQHDSSYKYLIIRNVNVNVRDQYPQNATIVQNAGSTWIVTYMWDYEYVIYHSSGEASPKANSHG